MAVFPNLVLSFTTPLQPVLSVLAPTYLTKPSALPHPHSHYHSCTFMVSLLYLVGQTSIWPFLPHLQPSPDPRSDVVMPLLEKVQMKAFENNLTCFSLHSLASCFSFHPIRACPATYSFAHTTPSHLSAFNSWNIPFSLLVSLTAFPSPLFYLALTPPSRFCSSRNASLTFHHLLG